MFSCEVCEIFQNTFFTEHLKCLLLIFRWLLLSFFFLFIFFFNFLNSYFTTLLWRINIFSSWHIVWCIKSGAHLFINLSSIVRFWSLEQYCSKHRFLDICRCAFNLLRINLRSLLWIPALTDIWSSLSVISILLLYETTSATH